MSIHDEKVVNLILYKKVLCFDQFYKSLFSQAKRNSSQKSKRKMKMFTRASSIKTKFRRMRLEILSQPKRNQTHQNRSKMNLAVKTLIQVMRVNLREESLIKNAREKRDNAKRSIMKI